MHSKNCHRQSLVERQEGVALIVTLMVLMLVSALMVGFVAAVVADTRASGLDRDQTQAYAAAHAGLEQITSDLNALFTADFSPTTAQITTIRATPPTVEGFTFIAPGGAAGSGYWVQPRFTDGNGNPRPVPAPGAILRWSMAATAFRRATCSCPVGSPSTTSFRRRHDPSSRWPTSRAMTT